MVVCLVVCQDGIRIMGVCLVVCQDGIRINSVPLNRLLAYNRPTGAM